MKRFVIAAVVILIIMLGLVWAIGSRGNKPKQDKITTDTSLVNFAQTPTIVRYTIEGRINGREDHRVIQFSIGQSTRTVTVYYGYEGNILSSKTLLNDVDSYRAFLAALDNSGYTKSRPEVKGVDQLAACPLGTRTHYDIIDGGDIKQSLWSASCKGSKGTFAGRTSTIKILFERQIPDYNQFIRGVRL